MDAQTKTCASCEQQFTIAPEDLPFYEGLHIPPPTWCPECRFKRRAMWRCERSLYKRNCDLCNKPLISIYSKEKPYKVYCTDCYHSDKWDPLNYGMDFDPVRPFLAQFKELQLKVPRLYAFVFQNTNSEYTNGAAFNKNCYLIFVSDHNEDSMYSYSVFYCRGSADLFNCTECELSYQLFNCKKCYKSYFSEDCTSSQNLYFSKNCVNCQDCVGCVNLRNASYRIFNVQYTKEDYLKEFEKLGLNSRSGLAAVGQKAHAFSKNFPTKYFHGLQNVGVVGDYTSNSKNCVEVYESELAEDSKYIDHGQGIKNCYDGYVVVDNSQFSCEIIGSIAINNVKFSDFAWNSFNVDYSDTCENSNNLFGCVSLRKKEYCILNKQYDKATYEDLRAKIIAQMQTTPYADKKGRLFGYGEFFPPEICPFSYNESVVQEYFPLSKDVAVEQGYSWKDQEEKNYNPTMPASAIPDSGIPPEITNEVLGCAHEGKCNDGCTAAFRVIPAEVQLYASANLPLPNLCPNCRHWERLRLRNTLKLNDAACACAGETSLGGIYKNVATHPHGKDKCTNVFKTTYKNDGANIVYCEVCYQSEVV